MPIKQLQPFNLDSSQDYTFNGVTIANVANFSIPGGEEGQALITDGTGNLSFGNVSSGGAGKSLFFNIIFGG